MQGIKAVKDADRGRGEHDKTRSRVVREENTQLAPVGTVDSHRETDVMAQVNCQQNEAEQNNAACGKRSEVDGAVFPKFAPDGPVQALKPGDRMRRTLRGAAVCLGKGTELCVHRAAPCTPCVGVPCAGA